MSAILIEKDVEGSSRGLVELLSSNLAGGLRNAIKIFKKNKWSPCYDF
jgi:hypothetical protein